MLRCKKNAIVIVPSFRTSGVEYGIAAKGQARFRNVIFTPTTHQDAHLPIGQFTLGLGERRRIAQTVWFERCIAPVGEASRRRTLWPPPTRMPSPACALSPVKASSFGSAVDVEGG